MRKLGFILVLGLLTLAGIPAADVAVTVYCDDGYTPYSYAEGGVAKGAYVEVLQTAFSRLAGYKVEIKALPWKRGLAMMQDGSGFAIFPPYKNTKDRPWMDYTLKLYDEKVIALLSAKGKVPATAVWPDDFKGLTIGLNSGYAFLDPWKGQFKVDESPDNATAVKKLALGRNDAYANDRVAMLATVKELRAKGELAADVQLVEGPVISKAEAFLGITNQDKGKFAFKADFVAQMKGILDKMAASGETGKIIDKYAK